MYRGKRNGPSAGDLEAAVEHLRVGTGTVSSVSERLAAAMEIGERVDRMLEGREGSAECRVQSEE